MTRLITFFVLTLLLPLTVFAQDPFERPSPPFQPQPELTQSGSLRGTVTSPDGAAIPGATVTIRNTNTLREQTVTTDESGGFRVVGLPPGPYEVIVEFASFAKKVVHVELSPEGVAPVSVQMGGNDVPVSSPSGGGGGSSGGGGGGGVGGGSTKSPPKENGADKPNKGTPATERASDTNPASNAVEVSEQSFKSDLQLVKWLTEGKNEKKLLMAIIPVSDQTSLFVLQRSLVKLKADYSAFLVDQPPDAVEVTARINQYPSKTFIGIHRLSSTSYLMVFYGK